MRRAIIETAPDILHQIGILADAGLKIEQSFNADFGRVRLLISGDALPVECAEPGTFKRVMIGFRRQTYGKQSITRVDAIYVTSDG